LVVTVEEAIANVEISKKEEIAQMCSGFAGP
jgi:hypothetical protein